MVTNNDANQYDVAIIGGSYAGLAAAMPLARARRKIAILDAGQRRNRAAHESHGFLTRDGESPGEIARIGREQVLAYPTVRWINGVANSVSGEQGDFELILASGESLQAQVLVLAMGVSDTLPEIPGLAERWGNETFACPYCHGYELQQGPVAVIATGPMSYHQAWMFPEWGEVTFFTNNAIDLDDEQRSELQGLGVSIDSTAVRAIENRADVRLEDDRLVSFNGIAVASTWQVNSQLPQHLGLEMVETPVGTIVKVDSMQATSMAGVFAAGDIAHGAHSVTAAVGSGFMAGIAAHRTLLMAR